MYFNTIKIQNNPYCFTFIVNFLYRTQVNSFKYTNSTYQSSINGSESLSTNVYTFRYIFGLIQALPERWRLTIDIVPNICADFKEPIGNEDFIFYGAVLAMKRVGPNREYGFGLAYASYVSLFEGPFIIPIYTLIKKKGKLTTRMILPTYFQQLYELNKNTQVGYRIDIDGNFHNVLYNKELAEFDLNAISNIKLTAGPYIQRKLFGDLYLNGKIGIIPVNYFSVLDDKRDKELSFFTGSNIYAKFGLSLLK